MKRVLPLLFAFVAAACTASEGNPSPEATTPTAQVSPPSPASDLPALIDVEEAGGQRIAAEPFPDWVLFAFGRVWVAGVADGIGIFDPATGDLVGSVALKEQQCASLGSGFGSVWTATCQPQGVARIDPETGEETGWVAVEVPSEGESSVGVGEGAVWAVADKGGFECPGCLLVEIDR